MTNHLSKNERLEIWRLLKDGKKHVEIALFLNRPQPTITKEINRNSIGGVYNPLNADKLSKQRRILANKNNTKLVRNIGLRDKIISKLSSKDEDWSPDTISGRLKKEKQEYVCTSTIYSYIYNHDQGLRKYLRYKKRYRKRGTKELRIIWNGTKHISLRDKSAMKRKNIGHREIDTIISSGRQTRGFTAVDRKSRLVKLRKVNSGKASEIYDAIIKSLKGEMILSLTSDNGKEFADRELVETQLQIPFYFATPYHSRERPSNENCNRCIRKYLNKKLDFTNVPEEYFERIEYMINNKPRKIHNYRTPFEVHYNKKTRLLP